MKFDIQLPAKMTKSNPVNSNFAVFNLFFVIIMSFFALGYHHAFMSPLIPVFKVMYNSTHTERYGTPLQEETWLVLLTLTISFTPVGGFLGAASCKYWLTLLSRKHALQLCHIVNIIGVLIFALVGGLTWSYEVMIIGRLVMGFPLGMYYNVVPITVAEICARAKQPFWQSVTCIAIAIGTVLGPLLSNPKLLGTLNLWPIVAAIGAVPSIAFLVASYWMVETPYYLLRRGSDEKVVNLLMKLRTGKKDTCMNELQEMKEEMKGLEVIGLKQMITVKQYRNQLFAVMVLAANSMLTGINHIVFYTDYVVRQAGVSEDTSGWTSIGILSTQLVSTTIGSKLVDRFGGWKLSIGSSVVIIIAFTLYTVSQATAHLEPKAMPILSVVAAAIFMFTWTGATNVASFALYGDLTIEPTRSTALMCSSIVLWSMSWFVGFIPPYLQKHLGPYSMTIWLGCTIIFLIYQVIFIPDTKGKTIDEIQAKFK